MKSTFKHIVLTVLAATTFSASACFWERLFCRPSLDDVVSDDDGYHKLGDQHQPVDHTKSPSNRRQKPPGDGAAHQPGPAWDQFPPHSDDDAKRKP